MKQMQVSASILSADLSNLQAVTAMLEQADVDMLHFDVMDGHFVPNLTFGMPVLAAVRQRTSLFLDVHLMISDPLRYAEQFADAGADLITFHLESDSDPQKTIDVIHEAGAQAGIVLKPDTPWNHVVPYLAQSEVVLVMTVEPGFGGQPFLWDMLKKIEMLHDYIQKHCLSCRIEVDGGINAETAPHVLRTGAEILVMGSFLFRQSDMAGTIRTLRTEAKKLKSVR